jgi:ribosomal protein S12 methylthiotransferase accessory factor YcaO
MKKIMRAYPKAYGDLYRRLPLHPHHLIVKISKSFLKLNHILMKDVLDDIRLILNRLKKSGLKKTIVVDLTNPSIGIPLVRAIVHGL